MSPTVADVLRDLVAEQDDLDRIVAGLSLSDFTLATLSPGWTVADQLGHLAYFDRTAALAIEDPDRFAEHRAELFAADPPVDGDLDRATLGEYRAMTPEELVASWRAARAQLATAAATLDDGDRVEWYGPSMGSKSFLTARLMEAWAHGQDIADTVGVDRPPTMRLVHIAQLGFITQKWSFIVRSEETLPVEVAVRLEAPDGSDWSWGDPDAPDLVRGPAADFCLVVTQRRHVDDTALELQGEHARRWMDNAQAFAGGPTSGPRPGGAS